MIRHKIIPLFFTFEDLDGVTATGCGDIPDVCCIGGAVEEARYCDHQAEVYGHLLSTVPSQSIFYVKNRVYS